MKADRRRALVFTLALLPLLTAGAAAQELGLSFSSRSFRGSIGIGYGAAPRSEACTVPVRRYATRGSVRAHRPVAQRVWVPGRWERVWVDPVYETRYQSCGTAYRVLVVAGHYRRVWRPGHYVTRSLARCY